MTPEPEVHHHTHRTGHRWIDLVVPLSALAVSVISLTIAIHHGNTMQKMADENARLVQANSWPLLQFATGNANDTGQPEITLKIGNAGVGPAKLISLEMFQGDKRIRTPRDLVETLDPATTRPQLSLGALRRDARFVHVLEAAKDSLSFSRRRIPSRSATSPSR